MLSNALKNTPAGGIIEAQLTHRGKDLQLTVRDSGSGIADSVLPNIFSRYLRTPGLEEPSQGIGLGMVLIRSAAAAHGGTVLVRRMPDGGTSITMTLAIRKKTDSTLTSPILHMDYAGGFDHALMELADVLPPELYQPK
jgi:signal transduction histidine kinase